MGALVHFNHGEGKRISLHYSVTDLISSGKRSRSLSQLRPLTSRQKGWGWGGGVYYQCIAVLCLSLEFTKMK